MTTTKRSYATSRPRAASSVVVRSGSVVRGSDGSYRVAVKLSDPDGRKDLQALQAKLLRDPKQAEALMRESGIHTATGRLTRRFGG